MTNTNSTADFFLKYFRYRLANGKFLLFLSTLTGLLSFVQCSIFILVSAIDIKNSEQYNEAIKDGIYAETINLEYWRVSRVFAYLSGAAIIGVVVFAAITSFNFCLKSHETDMLGSLPVTHRMRFWGDFVSGYVLSVLPFSVLAAVSIPIMSAAESYMKTTLYTELYAYVIVTVFFALSLMYAICVLAASISGRIISATACAAILVFASIYLLPCAGMFVAYSLAGMPYDDLSEKLNALTPSLMDLYDSVNFVVNNLPLLADAHLTIDNEYLQNIIDNSAAAQMLPNVIVWAAEIAALTAAAFFLTKFRKAERTGSAFGHKYGYYAVLFVTVVLITNIAFNSSSTYYLTYGSIVSVIICAVVFAVFEISMRRGWKNFGKGAAVLAGSVAVTLGCAFLVRYTGVFGLRNRLPDADDIVLAKFNDCEFADREDIELLRQNHLNVLKEYGNDLATGGSRSGSCTIEYQLKNGETFTRVYYAFGYGDEYERCSDALDNIPIMLKGYKEQLLKNFEKEDYEQCSVSLKGIFGLAEIKPEKMREFIEVLVNDRAGNADKGKKIGYATFYTTVDSGYGYVYNDKSLEFDIYDSYAKTIEFVRFAENIIVPENDEETICYTVNGYYVNGLTYKINILKKDLENEKVKELLSLTEEDDSYRRGYIYINSTDVYTNLYVPEANKNRFVKLLLEIFADKIAEN